MLKEHWRSIARIERVADNLIILASFFLAYYGRSSAIYWNKAFGWNLPFAGSELAPLGDYIIVLLVALPLYNLMLSVMGAYGSMRLSSSWRLLRTTGLASLVVFFVLASVLFVLKIDLSRVYLGLFCLINSLSLAAERYLVLCFLRYWRKKGRNYRNIIVSGFGEQALAVVDQIQNRPELGLKLVAYVDLENLGADQVPQRLLSYPRISGVCELECALKEHAVDEVIFTDIVRSMEQVEEAIVICAEEGVRTTIAADLFSIGMVKSEVSYFGSMPLIHFQTPPGDRWELALKRIIDVFVAVLLIIVLSPLFLLIGTLVKLTSAGPVFFKQKRMGLNGRMFSLYKFRSMCQEAESQLKDLRARNEMSGPVFKMKKDPRVTFFGRLLRRFSLDELPQLWNVLRGDMSLVGPRPPVPGEVNEYTRKYRRRLSMRPGLTCTWQVSGRNEIKDFESWMELDLDYIDNWSLGRDFVILCRTVPAVIFGAGAR